MGPREGPNGSFAHLAPQPIIPTSTIGSPSLPIADRVRTPDHPSRDAPAPSGASACSDQQLVSFSRVLAAVIAPGPVALPGSPPNRSWSRPVRPELLISANSPTQTWHSVSH